MEINLDLLESTIAEAREFKKENYEVAFVNSESWRKCQETARKLGLIGESSLRGEWVWGMKVVAIPEIPEDTMILYSSPDNYKVVKIKDIATEDKG